MAEWIDHSFLRSAPSTAYCNGHRAEKADRQTGNNLMEQPQAEYPPAPSPLASAYETEVEDEQGITFVAKKYQDEPRRMSFNMTVRGHQAAVLTGPDPDGTSFDESARSGKDGSRAERSENGDPRQAKQEGHILEASKPATPRQAGQTISETELMRRRRLLDSHIFDQDKKV